MLYLWWSPRTSGMDPFVIFLFSAYYYYYANSHFSLIFFIIWYEWNWGADSEDVMGQILLKESLSESSCLEVSFRTLFGLWGFYSWKCSYVWMRQFKAVPFFSLPYSSVYSSRMQIGFSCTDISGIHSFSGCSIGVYEIKLVLKNFTCNLCIGFLFEGSKH